MRQNVKSGKVSWMIMGFGMWLFSYSILFAYSGIVWTNTYGGNSSDAGTSIKATSDGGYIIAGYTNSFGVEGTDVYVLKINSEGDTIWTRIVGGNLDEKGV